MLLKDGSWTENYSNVHVCYNNDFKPGADQCVPGFLILILCGSLVCMFACVCLSAPEAFNSKWHNVA